MPFSHIKSQLCDSCEVVKVLADRQLFKWQQQLPVLYYRVESHGPWQVRQWQKY